MKYLLIGLLFFIPSLSHSQEEMPLPPLKLRIATEQEIKEEIETTTVEPAPEELYDNDFQMDDIEIVDYDDHEDESTGHDDLDITDDWSGEHPEIDGEHPVEIPEDMPAPPVTPHVPPMPTPPSQTQPDRRTPPAARSTLREELSLFNVPTANLRTMKVVIDDNYDLRGVVYGNNQGYLYILESDPRGNMKEVWQSPSLNGPVGGVFVDDLDGDGRTQIVAYTQNGNIFIFDYYTRALLYRTPEGQYSRISSMAIANIDTDPQKELVFIGTKFGESRLIQFDSRTRFEEWVSSETYNATDLIIGNVDQEEGLEIILNTGEVICARYKNVKWKGDFGSGGRLFLLDVDSDGVLELIVENNGNIRIFDIDERREKW